MSKHQIYEAIEAFQVQLCRFQHTSHQLQTFLMHLQLPSGLRNCHQPPIFSCYGEGFVEKRIHFLSLSSFLPHSKNLLKANNHHTSSQRLHDHGIGKTCSFSSINSVMLILVARRIILGILSIFPFCFKSSLHTLKPSCVLLNHDSIGLKHSAT